METVKNLIDYLAERINFHHIVLPSFDLQSKSFQLVGLITAILVSAFLINLILSHTFLGQRYRLFVAPGVILHEIAHAFFCLLTGAKIKKIAFFDKDGGRVEHEKSMIPILGQILISFAPFLFGAIAIYYLSKYLGIKESQILFTNISYESIIKSMISALNQLSLDRWQTWAILYVVISIAVTMTPSKKDFENVFISVLILAAVLFVFFHFTSFNFPSQIIPVSLFALLNSVLILLILALMFSIVIYVLSFAIKHK